MGQDVFQRVYSFVRERDFGPQNESMDWEGVCARCSLVAPISDLLTGIFESHIEAEEEQVKKHIAAEIGAQNLHYWYWVQELIFCEESLSGR